MLTRERVSGAIGIIGIGALIFTSMSIEVSGQAVAGVSEALMEEVEIAETDPWEKVGILYSTGKVNVRTQPDTDSEVYCTLNEYEPVKVYEREGSDWYKTKAGHYIYGELLTDEIPNYRVYELYSGFKSYTDYRALTAVDCPQWRLQQIAYTGDYGIRQVDGRYCVALGSRFRTQIGQKFDVVLADGTKIPCVMADQKSDRHTDPTHTYSLSCGCATEFYVDTGSLYSEARTSGDLSAIWAEAVTGIVVYDEFVW